MQVYHAQQRATYTQILGRWHRSTCAAVQTAQYNLQATMREEITELKDRLNDQQGEGKTTSERYQELECKYKNAEVTLEMVEKKLEEKTLECQKAFATSGGERLQKAQTL